MKKYIQSNIEKIRWLRGSAVLAVGVVDALRFGMVKRLIASWFSKQPPVIVYCHFISHLQNASGIIDEMSVNGYKISLFLGFASGGELKEKTGVTILRIPKSRMLGIFRAKLFITPVVGYPRMFTPMGSIAVHFLHSLISLEGVYADSHFDDFDYIFCAVDSHFVDFHKFAKRNNNLAGKVLIPGGYPKLDDQICWFEKYREANYTTSTQKVVIYAPTLVNADNEEFASLRRYGEDIVKSLLNSGFIVIFRPHPVSSNDADIKTIENICNEHRLNPRFSLDRSANYMETYACANLMVTDLSGTGFTFAFTFLRPAVFFAPNADAEVGLEGIQFHSRHEIGDVVRSLFELGDRCLSLLAHQDEIEAKIARFRDKTVFNLGTSAKYFCQCLPYIERGEMDKGWVVL